MTYPASLASGLVTENFALEGDDLLVGGVPVRVLAERFGTPLFIYDGGVMRRSYRSLATALAGFADIHFSVKANPSPRVIALFVSEGAGLEVASVGEFRRALLAGAAPSRVLFAGPGKRPAELEETIDGGIGEIHVETHEEIARIDAIGARLGRRVPVAIRINPVAAAQGGAMRMGGKATPFGFDEEEIEAVLTDIEKAAHLDLCGVHLFAGTQILEASVLLEQWEHGLDLAARVCGLVGRPLRTIDLGGGLGIPYFVGDKSLDLKKLAGGIPALAQRKAAMTRIASARVIVEPGRFLAGPGGLYVSAVNAVKRSRGNLFWIIDGGMHHHLAASGNLGQVVKRDYPVIAPALMSRPANVTGSVVGPLCTPLDALARKAELPELAPDALIAVMQSGAYALTASPIGFLSHPMPTEVLVEDGNATLL